MGKGRGPYIHFIKDAIFIQLGLNWLISCVFLTGFSSSFSVSYLCLMCTLKVVLGAIKQNKNNNHFEVLHVAPHSWLIFSSLASRRRRVPAEQVPSGRSVHEHTGFIYLPVQSWLQRRRLLLLLRWVSWSRLTNTNHWALMLRFFCICSWETVNSFTDSKSILGVI